jgi:hypothetical protein
MANIHHPPSLINAYLAAKIDSRFNDGSSFKFFPTSPVDINSLTEYFPEGNGKFAVYDRMLRMRRSAFPHIKCEQLMYYFYHFSADAVPELVDITGWVEDLLNNGDESAQDLNEWALANPELWSGSSLPVFFHNFKVYQLQETRDIIDFGTARTYAGNKIIVDFDWHKG